MATKKRLIDANEFLNWLVKRFHCIPLVGSSDLNSESMKFLLSQAPTVDAVEVVRCKDCKYAMDMMPIENSGGCLMGECTLRKEDDIVFTAWGDEFCSYGERKDNGM